MTEATAYDLVRQRLISLIEPWDLTDAHDRILATYDTICRRSLTFPLGAKPPYFSRLNEDGTPIQFATAVGVPYRAVRFLGEAGWPGASGETRQQAGRACMAEIAGLLGIEAELDAATNLLSELAPEDDPALLTDSSGTFWIGAAFAPSRPSQLRIYVNGSWGREKDRWARLRQFASHFGRLEAWIKAEYLLMSHMEPLGVALTLASGAATRGSIYLRAFGNRIDYYETLARAVSGDPTAEIVRHYAECLLGEDISYPTPSVVCSFGLGSGRTLDFDLELCGHCLFSSDGDGRERLLRCFEVAGVDAGNYLNLLEVLSGGRLHDGAPQVHSFAGVGVKRGKRAFSVYMKPSLVECR